jgi:hypothetical protein
MLYDSNFGAADAATSEITKFAARKSHSTIAISVDRKVAAQFRTDAGTLGETNLTNDDLAD